MTNNLIETVGYVLLVAFLWFVWPPLVLLGAGVLLVVLANVRAARTRRPARPLLPALMAAANAARNAYRVTAAEETSLRRVS